MIKSKKLLKIRKYLHQVKTHDSGFPGDLGGKEFACTAGDQTSIPE